MFLVRSAKLVTRVIPAASFGCRFFAATPKPLSDEMVERIIKRDEELRKDYYDMPESFPETSQAPDHKVTMEEALRKRLLHRSRQRGMLEVDLLLGKWASENINRLTRDELDQYEALLNSETVDIFGWIMDKNPLPSEMDLPIIREIQRWVKSKPFGVASPEEYEKNKKYFSNYNGLLQINRNTKTLPLILARNYYKGLMCAYRLWLFHIINNLTM